jgi:hypothetical protein
MTEPQLRTLFEEIADGEPAASRVDPESARRRGHARLRWRRACLSGASVATTAAVITASLAVSGAIEHRATRAPSAAPVFGKVPPFFVAMPGDTPGPAIVVATASGDVRGTVAPPKAYPVFAGVAAARASRTFVIAAAHGMLQGPVALYRLVLSQSGRPGRLTQLPLPPETSSISGLALSPDGSKLAVSLLGPRNRQRGAKIQVFSLRTWAERQWVWPGSGWIGSTVPAGPSEFDARSLSWANDNRTLLFEERTDTHTALNAQARLLDTAAPGSNLLASSTRVPIPGAELSQYGKSKRPPFYISGTLLLTGDGTKIIAPTSRNITHGKAMLSSSITEFSVRTGKPVDLLAQQQLRYDNGADVLWVNSSGSVMIVALPKPSSGGLRESVIGVQTPTAFTPLPPRVQHETLTGPAGW